MSPKSPSEEELNPPLPEYPERTATMTTSTSISSSSSILSQVKQCFQIAGPGMMVAVGYFDPGNWATGLSGGSQFGYQLLFVVLFSSVMAMYLQYLCIKLGAIRGLDLAEASRRYFHPIPNAILYFLAEVSICATDLAEVIGSAIAMKLLFGLSLTWGVAITGLDVFLILLFWNSKKMRFFEGFIGILVLIIGICFLILVFRVSPTWSDVFYGYIPSAQLVTKPNVLYIGLGILGATVMPHNLYLHSNIIMYKTHPGRMEERERESVVTAPSLSDDLIDLSYCSSITSLRVLNSTAKTIWGQVKMANLDSVLSLTYALLINSAILIVAAAAFHERGLVDVANLEDAYTLLGTWLGHPFAVLFAVALFLSGQSSTITGTMAGQIVMQGFMGDMITLPPWSRRLITRLIVIIPALVVVIYSGEEGINNLLIFSQVVLSIQLPFALWPLIYFTSSKAIMTITVADERLLELDDSLDENDLIFPANVTTSSPGESTVSYHILEADSTCYRSNSNTNETCFANSILSTFIGVAIASLLTALNILLLVQVVSGSSS